MSVYRPERDWPRYVPVNEILVSVYDRKLGQAYGEVTNISSAGACISANRHFRPDTTVLLRISFHKRPDAFVAQAEVVWSRDESNGKHPHAHGVKFCFNEEEQRSVLNKILESPDFKLASPADNEKKETGDGLDNLVVELTDDLDKLGESCHRVIGGGD